MTTAITEALAQAEIAWAATRRPEAIACLNRLRAAYPMHAAVARHWCRLALRLGQPEDVPAYARQVYERSADALERALLTLYAGTAWFQQLKLERAQRCFALSLEHLCDLAEQGTAPARQSPSPAPAAFASGAAETLLWQVCGTLAQAGLAVFPYAGTLLGLVREGQLLPNDKDVDLGIWIEDLPACSQALLHLGWQAATNHWPYANFRAFIDPRTGLTLDLSGLRREPERIVSGFWLDGHPDDYQRVLVYPCFELVERCTPAGLAWWPAAPEIVLESLYGDWRTPNPHWDGVISACNLEAFTLQVRVFAYQRLTERWLAGQLECAWSYAHQILLKDPADALAKRARACLESLLDALALGASRWPHSRGA